MNTHNLTPQKREDALAQFKTAQKMLSEGQADLVKAQEKIEQARKLIEQSTDVIRQTWASGRPARIAKKK